MSSRVEAIRGARALLVWACSVLLIAIPTSVLAQARALTLPQNVSDLVTESHVVVQGWITQVSLAPHPSLRNLMMVVVTVRIEDTFKGTVSGTYTFHQAAIDRRDQQDKLGYRSGEHVLLFLIKPNTYGLSSTAGLEQGRFRISLGPQGSLVATNSLGNAGLFRALPVEVQQSSGLAPRTRSLLSKASPGPIDVQQLKAIVRSIASQSLSQ